MAPPLIQLTDIHLTFGGDPLLEGVNLAVSAGERVCLVGRNGSGKSTLLKIAAGLIEADAGTRFVQPGALVKYLAQEPDLTAYETTLAYVEAGLGPTDDLHQARYMLERVGLTGAEDTHNLSGGEARRAALAHALAPNPDILLLDEPTNHLDLPAIEWLEEELAGVRGALVLISHDRRFLQDLTRGTVWLTGTQALGGGDFALTNESLTHWLLSTAASVSPMRRPMRRFRAWSQASTNSASYRAIISLRFCRIAGKPH